MKVLHTSDWHLGRSLHRRKRLDEFAAFLQWLTETIEDQKIDILLVAGDIFDTPTPGNKSQELYYQFLNKASNTCCRHIIVIGGNHDSPSFLNAPKDLLRDLNVHVVGSATENIEEEVIVLHDKENEPEAIVCAVPYLRDRDLRTVEAGETADDKLKKLTDGLKLHYADVCEIAEKRQNELGDVPIIAMGHLFTDGGKIIDEDGVRDLYVGSLAHIKEDTFKSCIDYLALGHLHVSQRVGEADHMRYSGSPIPMGFGEARQDKKVVVIEFDGKTPEINQLIIPVFQQLEKITGNIEEIQDKIKKLKDAESSAWLDVEYSGDEIAGNLTELLDEAVSETNIEILRIQNKRIRDKALSSTVTEETLDDLDHNQVFERCLDAHEVTEVERPQLIDSYGEITRQTQENDQHENS